MINQTSSGGFWYINNSDSIVAMWEQMSDKEQIDYKVYADDLSGEFRYITTSGFNYCVLPASGVSRIFLEAYNRHGTYLRKTAPVNVPVNSDEVIEVRAVKSYRGTTVNWSAADTFAPYYFMRKNGDNYDIMFPMHMFQITLDKISDGDVLKIVECTAQGAPAKVSKDFVYSQEALYDSAPEEIKLSVIIPVYNDEKSFTLSVDSVLCSTMKDIEIIIADAGSTDGTPAAADWYAENYPDKVKVIHTGDIGLAAAMNEGVKAAKGGYVAFIDSGDLVGANMYGVLYERASAEDCDIGACALFAVEPKDGAVASLFALPCDPEKVHDTNDMLAEIYRGSYLSFSLNDKIYKKELLEAHPLPGDVVEDNAWAIALCSHAKKFCSTRYPFYCRNMNVEGSKNTSSNILRKMSQEERINARIQSCGHILGTGDQSRREHLMLVAARLIADNLVNGAISVEEGKPFAGFITGNMDEIKQNGLIAEDKELSAKLKAGCERYGIEF